MKSYIAVLSTSAALLPLLMATPASAPSAAEDDIAGPSVSAAALEVINKLQPFTDARIANVEAEPQNWPLSRRSSNQWGFSPLNQITPQNINQITLAWTAGIPAQRNQQEPLVLDGVMFALGGDAKALDATTGEEIWSFHDDDNKDEFISMARSLSVYRDKVIYPGSDTEVIALDMKTGKKVWNVDTFDGIETTKEYVKSHRFSAGPQVGGGNVILGTACMYQTVPCYVAGVDIDSGKIAWRRAAIDANDPKNVVATWTDVPVEKRYKASFWGTGSYDPKTNTTYWGSASPSPYPEVVRGGTGDVKWTNSTLAIDNSTGKLKWAFQHMPRDNWDMDTSGGGRVFKDGQKVQPDASLKWFNPKIKNGATRNVIYSLGKPGILWALDRDTGEFLWAKETLNQNLYKNIDGKGKVTLDQNLIPKKIGDTVTICPASTGRAILWQFGSYSPDTNTLYFTQQQRCGTVTPIDNKTGSGFRTGSSPMPGAHPTDISQLIAIDASTGKTLWTYNQPAMMYSTTTTAGGLVFVGDDQRNFMAFDAKTGAKLWNLPLSGTVTGIPISYGVNGRQYVSVTVGGAQGAVTRGYTLPRRDNTIIMTFALPKAPQ